jgi:hypothetical protein
VSSLKRKIAELEEEQAQVSSLKRKIAELEADVTNLTSRLDKETAFRGVVVDAFTNDGESVDLFSEVYDEVNTPVWDDVPTTPEDLGLGKRKRRG